MNALEERFFDLTNRQRARRWLRPLADDAALSNAARRHSEDMLQRRFFAHVNPDQQSFADRIAAAVRRPVWASAENIWMRTGLVSSTALSIVIAEAFAQLMASSPHRRNMMDARYSHVGVGVIASASDIRLTQVFARFEP